MELRTFNWPNIYIIILVFVCLILQVSTLNQPSAEAIVVEGPTVNEGDSIMLSCAVFNVSGERARSFRMEWRRDAVVLTRGKKVLSPDPRYRVTIIDGVSDRRDFVLHIDNVNRNDTGRYVCWVVVRDWYPSVPVKRASSSVDLTVRYFPQQPQCHHDGLSDVIVAGTNVRFVCKVEEGEPIVRTRWKGPKGMVLFAHESNRENFIYNVLTFQATSTHNGMEFTCEVTSEADVFAGVSSSCRVGPIEIIGSIASNDVTFYSSSSYSEYSVDIPGIFSEAAPLPQTTRQSTNKITETIYPATVTPKLGLVENSIPIGEPAKYIKLCVSLSVVVLMLVISMTLNILLYYKVQKSKPIRRGKANVEDNVVPSVCSGVSNEEYMDMQDQRQGHHDSEFYSTISGDTMRAAVRDVQYDSPRSSIAVKPSVSPENSLCHSNSIYENLGGRPVTPPRTRRKSYLMEEHVV